jgi:hypothetical protein
VKCYKSLPCLNTSSDEVVGSRWFKIAWTGVNISRTTYEKFGRPEFLQSHKKWRPKPKKAK